jgi:lipoprotein-anchoring transpeptidase ErfK/SrfK
MIAAQPTEDRTLRNLRVNHQGISGACRAFAVATGIFLAACLPDPAAAQAGAMPRGQELLQVDDQPGRISTEEAVIAEGPYARQLVFFRSSEPPGTLVIHTSERFAYLLQGNNRALRYGIGVGREGFQWAGLVRVSRKAEWPDWRPPPEMIARQPYLPRFMAGGPGNPMGARALYLGSTVFRIHGTNQPETIGHAISSGCFRLANGDIIDLYARVPTGTKVVVRHGASL